MSSATPGTISAQNAEIQMKFAACAGPNTISGLVSYHRHQIETTFQLNVRVANKKQKKGGFKYHVSGDTRPSQRTGAAWQKNCNQQQSRKELKCYLKRLQTWYLSAPKYVDHTLT